MNLLLFGQRRRCGEFFPMTAFIFYGKLLAFLMFWDIFRFPSCGMIVCLVYITLHWMCYYYNWKWTSFRGSLELHICFYYGVVCNSWAQSRNIRSEYETHLWLLLRTCIYKMFVQLETILIESEAGKTNFALNLFHHIWVFNRRVEAFAGVK